MDKKIDNAILTSLQLLAISVALASVFAANTAHAEYKSYDYFEMRGYDSELQQCVELLRPTLGAVQNERTRYTVEDIDLRGPWYSFEIVASVFGIDGRKRVDSFKVRCKSNRWTDSARLIKRKNAPTVDRALVVKTTSELVSYNLLATNTATN